MTKAPSEGHSEKQKKKMRVHSSTNDDRVLDSIKQKSDGKRALCPAMIVLCQLAKCLTNCDETDTLFFFVIFLSRLSYIHTATNHHPLIDSVLSLTEDHAELGLKLQEPDGYSSVWYEEFFLLQSQDI